MRARSRYRARPILETMEERIALSFAMEHPGLAGAVAIRRFNNQLERAAMQLQRQMLRTHRIRMAMRAQNQLQRIDVVGAPPSFDT
jgi:hypothetical protein